MCRNITLWTINKVEKLSTVLYNLLTIFNNSWPIASKRTHWAAPEATWSSDGLLWKEVSFFIVLFLNAVLASVFKGEFGACCVGVSGCEWVVELMFSHYLWSNLNYRRKREAREVHKRSEKAQRLHGLKAKLYNKQRHSEKIQMKKA